MLPSPAEWVPVRSLLPPLVGQEVVDLGCGTGTFVRWAHEQGAAGVLGLDLSPEILARARSLGEPVGTRFEQSDLEQVRLGFASYDLAWCARTAHLLDDPLRLARVVNAGLRPGGAFVVSVPTGEAPAVRDAMTGARMDLALVEEVEGVEGVGAAGGSGALTVLLARKRQPGLTRAAYVDGAGGPATGPAPARPDLA